MENAIKENATIVITSSHKLFSLGYEPTLIILYKQFIIYNLYLCYREMIESLEKESLRQ